MSIVYTTENSGIKLVSFTVGSFAVNCTAIIDIETSNTLLFDPGLEPDDAITFIDKHKLNVRKIIHTHGHFDHIGCSSEISRKTQGSLHLHINDHDLYLSMHEHAKMFGININPDLVPISYLFNEGDTFKLDGTYQEISFETIHTPGHSPGSCSFYTDFFEQPILIAGDTLFQGSIGRTDLPGGDFNTLISSIKDKLFKYQDNTVVIAGHGPSTTIEQEKKFNPFLDGK